MIELSNVIEDTDGAVLSKVTEDAFVVVVAEARLPTSSCTFIKMGNTPSLKVLSKVAVAV